MMVVLIAAMSVGFTSCSKEDVKEDDKEPDISLILGKWYYVIEGQIDTRYSLEFNSDKTFSCFVFWAEHQEVHGVIDMITAKKTTLSELIYLEYVPEVTGKTYDATLFTMRASGFTWESNITQIVVYHYYPSPGGDGCLFVLFTDSGSLGTVGQVFRKTGDK